jgi:tryptophan-rich sensory protein
VLVLAALWAVLAPTIQSFRRVDSGAAVLMLPYAIGIGYATYLAAGFWWLN